MLCCEISKVELFVKSRTKIQDSRPDPVLLISWALFDFANSSYSAVIAAVIFPVYYVNVIVGNETGLGDLWWGRAISLSMAIVALSSPFLGGIADFAGLRKRFLFIYTFFCVSAVACFSLLDKGMALTGFILIVIANIGMEGGLVFYNSFLPLIAPREFLGRVSAWGFMVGYAGSIAALLISLCFIKIGKFSLVWLIVAAFFAIFSLPAFLFLPNDKKKETLLNSSIKGFMYIKRTFIEIFKNKNSLRFLISYFIYEDGVNTVIVFSSIFAAVTLGFNSQELIFLYLIVQATAFIGSFIMARPIDSWGPKKVVVLSLMMWSLVGIAAYFIKNKTIFWMLASFAGLGLGTVQAASRAFFARFIPSGKEAEYFGIYSLVGKSSAILGPLIFGYISSTFGSQRPAILSVTLFFLVGLVILYSVKEVISAD
jgi:UMF1 family MFS transporter